MAREAIEAPLGEAAGLFDFSSITSLQRRDFPAQSITELRRARLDAPRRKAKIGAPLPTSMVPTFS